MLSSQSGSLLDAVQRAATLSERWADLTTWRDGFHALGREGWTLGARSFLSGAHSDRLAFAFAGAHQSALRQLFPKDLGETDIGALCISEAGGAHPRAIATTAKMDGEAWVINGSKTYTTLMPLASTLWVACKLDDAPAANSGPQGLRPRLKIARVSAEADGLTQRAMPPPPFCPELPHGLSRFERVKVRRHAMLPGDGYETVIRPFRTIEDIHVTLGLVGYLFSVASQNAWPSEALESLAAMALALDGLQSNDPTLATTHIALAGVFGQLARWRERFNASMSSIPSEEYERWRRDQPVLNLAERARIRRRESAWKRLTGSPA